MGFDSLASSHIPFNINWLGKSLSGNTSTYFVNNCGRVFCSNMVTLKSCKIMVNRGTTHMQMLHD